MRPILTALTVFTLASPALAYDQFDEDFSHDVSSATPYRATYLLAALTEVVYDKNKLRKKKWKRLGVSEVAYKNNTKHDAQASIVTSDDYIFLVIRGTKQVKDYVQDVRGVKDHKWSKDKTKVHAGFGDQAGALYSWAKKNIARHRGSRKLWITGHSLGGVVGNLLAYRLVRDAGVAVDGVVTFGAPKAAGGGWKSKYTKRLGSKSWRWINRHDPIAHEPRGKGWKAVGQRRVIRKGNTLKFNNPSKPKGNWLRFGDHHGSTKYLRAFWKGMPSAQRASMPRPKLIAPSK